MNLQDLARFELTVICTGEINDLLPGQIPCERFCLKHSEFSISDECRRCKVQVPLACYISWKPTTKKIDEKVGYACRSQDAQPTRHFFSLQSNGRAFRQLADWNWRICGIIRGMACSLKSFNRKGKLCIRFEWATDLQDFTIGPVLFMETSQRCTVVVTLKQTSFSRSQRTVEIIFFRRSWFNSKKAKKLVKLMMELISFIWLYSVS